MPLNITKEIREIIIDIIRLKYHQGKVTTQDLDDRAKQSLSSSLILNLNHLHYFQESSDGILSVSLAYQNADQHLVVAVGDLDPLQNSSNVLPSTAYNISSISKFLLMMMCCRLIQAEKVSLDSIINLYINEKTLPNMDQIILSHLLAHRSGFKDKAFIAFRETDALLDFIKRKENGDFDLAGKPGSEFYYANINYILVARIITNIMNCNLEEALHELIVKPLGIKDLTCIPLHSLTADKSYTKGYQANKERIALEDSSDFYIFGASAFRATPSSLTQLITNFFNDKFIYRPLREQILNSIHDELFELITPKNVYRWPAKVGMGIEEVHIQLDSGSTIKVYGHGGWQNSHASFMVFDPNDGSAYASCFSKTFGLEKIYQSYLKKAWLSSQCPLFLYNTTQNLKIPLMGLGCVHLSPENNAIIERAVKRGVTFFDTAEMYGNGLSEIALGEALKSYPRMNFFISSKGGVRFENGLRLSGKPEDIKGACEASLARLKTDYLDLYYLHRVDPKTPIETSMMALKDLVKAGKIRNIGLSEVTEEQLYRAHRIHPVSALQIEYSPWSRHDETNGLINVCKDLGIAVVAYSPLGRAFFTNVDEYYFDQLPQDDFRRLLPRLTGNALIQNKLAQNILKAFAINKGLTVSQLVLVWIMSKGVCVIPGTTNVHHLDENLGALLVKMTPSDIKELNELINSLNFFGERYPSPFVSGIFKEESKKDSVISQRSTFTSKEIVQAGVLTVVGFFAWQNHNHKLRNTTSQEMTISHQLK